MPLLFLDRLFGTLVLYGDGDLTEIVWTRSTVTYQPTN